MAKTKSRPKTVNSKYYKGVTATWRPPSHEAIPIIYHEAVESLADWVGPGWQNNEDTGFFPLRDLILRQIEIWQQHDWCLDKSQISKARADKTDSKNVISAFDNFYAELSKSGQNDAFVWLGHSIAGYLNPGLPRTGDDKEYAENVKRGLRAFRNNFLGSRKDSFRFGPLEYRGLPKRLPDRQIATAILICDIITSRRIDIKDSGKEKSLRESRWTGNFPRLSEKLPWRTIGLFVTADQNMFDGDLEFSNLQHRVESAIKSISSIHLEPMP